MREPLRARRAAAMAPPCPLNRYLLLMAQEHLEFRLPVSPQCPSQFLAGEVCAMGWWRVETTHPARAHDGSGLCVGPGQSRAPILGPRAGGRARPEVCEGRPRQTPSQLLSVFVRYPALR